MEIQTQELHELFLLFGTYRYAIAIATAVLRSII